MLGLISAKKRRGNGEGSIYQRKVDGLWVGEIIIGYNSSNGKPKRKCFYSKSRKEVAEKVNKALSELQKGIFIEPNKITVGQWLDKWMDVYQTKISSNFYARRKSLIELHIKLALKDIHLMKLKPSDVQELYNRLEKEGRIDKQGGLASGFIAKR